MAGYIRAEAERFKTKGLNTKVNKDILYKFKVKCKERGLVLNNVVEAFVSQYGKGRYKLKETDILKWKDDKGETEIINCMIEEVAYNRFKETVKDKDMFIKYVLSAFIEDFINNDLVLEFTERINEGDD